MTWCEPAAEIGGQVLCYEHGLIAMLKNGWDM